MGCIVFERPADGTSICRPFVLYAEPVRSLEVENF